MNRRSAYQLWPLPLCYLNWLPMHSLRLVEAEAEVVGEQEGAEEGKALGEAEVQVERVQVARAQAAEMPAARVVRVVAPLAWAAALARTEELQAERHPIRRRRPEAAAGAGAETQEAPGGVCGGF